MKERLIRLSQKYTDNPEIMKRAVQLGHDIQGWAYTKKIVVKGTSYSEGAKVLLEKREEELNTNIEEFARLVLHDELEEWKRKVKVLDERLQFGRRPI
jgi:hypothetical protein